MILNATLMSQGLLRSQGYVWPGSSGGIQNFEKGGGWRWWIELHQNLQHNNSSLMYQHNRNITIFWFGPPHMVKPVLRSVNWKWLLNSEGHKGGKWGSEPPLPHWLKCFGHFYQNSYKMTVALVSSAFLRPQKPHLKPYLATPWRGIF